MAGTAHASSKKCFHEKKTKTHILTHRHPFAVTPLSLSLLDIVVIVALPFFTIKILRYIKMNCL